MKRRSFSERGQALVIVALAIIGLLALTALTIDGGNVYSDRRHAQNAADTSVLASALSKVRGNNWKQDALNRASDNGYADTDFTSSSTSSKVNVEVYSCDEPASDCREYAGNNQYVQVIITSVVDTYFARILGISQMTNKVNAISRATIPTQEPWFDGHAIVSLMPGCQEKQPHNHQPFIVGGSSYTDVNLSGVFVNSNCEEAFDQQGNPTMTTDTGVCIVGEKQGGFTTGNVPAPVENCSGQVNQNAYTMPNPSCDTNGTITEISAKNYVASPGNYYGTFPDVSPAGTIKLEKGIYCLHDGFQVNAGYILTTDLNDNNAHDSSEGVLFYVAQGDVTLNGGATFHVNAINSTVGGFPNELLNLLFYVEEDGAVVSISGNSGSEFTGTILAPLSHVVIQGSGGVLSLNTQIIGYSTELTGDGTINITYNAGENNIATTNPNIELTK